MRLQLVIIHFLWLQLVPSVPRSSSSSCIVALIAPHTTSCFIVNTAAAPYCTYDQKVMRRLFRLLTAAGFIHTKKKKKKASTAVKQLTWEQKKTKTKSEESAFCALDVLHGSFVFSISAASRTEIPERYEDPWETLWRGHRFSITVGHVAQLQAVAEHWWATVQKSDSLHERESKSKTKIHEMKWESAGTKRISLPSKPLKCCKKTNKKQAQQ